MHVLGETRRGEVDQAEREATWAQWMRQALAGNERDYRLLLEALAARLRVNVRYRFARMSCGDLDVEDVVQETLLAIHLKRHTWRVEEPIGPWVAAISRNKLVDVLRRRGRRAELPLEEIDEPMAEAPESGADEDVARLLEGLNARQRDIIRLVSIEGHSAREAAGRLGMNEGALRVALHRALRTLAAQLRH
jgi:RNA polymerase sigma factor (sigma-70 family)